MPAQSAKRNGLPRRRFLAHSAGLAVAATTLALPSTAAEEASAPSRRYRAAIIGHTGKGNYGHGLDVCFNDRDDVEVVAVADPDAAGRAKAAQRAKAPRQYADFREMLAQEKPQLVSVAPRWTDQHHAMALAALQAGAHVYSEKPFTTSLAEADELLAAAAKAGLRIAVAHQMRLAPNVLHLKKLMDAGLLGEPREMRSHGKQDRRAGGEDLMVLGVHLFNLMHFFAGEALWCSARVLHQGRAVTLADARPASENIGLVAGDDISAEFGFANDVRASFTSRAKDRESAGPWGIELAGSKGTARIAADIPPKTFVRKSGAADGAWEPLPDDPTLNAQPDKDPFAAANRRMVDELLAAVREKREPACSGRDGMKAVEMVMAVYHAGVSGARVQLPLAQREHPLAPATKQ
ncbi:MAG: Gfo/Idh/MocA family oxidoreductase [Planctomycetota bacterium]|nr:Gfo/Idh/MocA family oxidoreductase [Planctomycetota bacterium]